MDLLCFFCLVFAMPLYTSVNMCLVCYFPIGILGQVWYLIVSIPDLCTLITNILVEENLIYRFNYFRAMLSLTSTSTGI